MSSQSGSLGALFERDQSTVSAWLASPDPLTQEAFLGASFDLATFDMQHGLLTKAEVRDGIARAAACHKPVVVRLPVGQFALSSWVLDMGASGIIMPMIETVEEARELVKQAKYPPLGLRSYGPARAATLLKRGDAGAYVESANAETFTFAMIETRRALEAIDEIAAIDGLDGLFVGPADLSIALSDDSKPDLEGERVLDAMRTIVSACRTNGKVPACYATTAEQGHRYRDLGFRYVCVGMDLKVIADGAERLAKAVIQTD